MLGHRNWYTSNIVKHFWEKVKLPTSLLAIFHKIIVFQLCFSLVSQFFEVITWLMADVTTNVTVV
jgi:hypothetical protein